MSALAQTYLLASKVKQKLTKEAVNPNANLRILVCQANLLDNLMDSLQHKKPLPNFPQINISSMSIQEENNFIDDEDDEEEFDDEEFDSYEIGLNNLNSPTNVTTTELSDDDEDESDVEDYNCNSNSFKIEVVTEDLNDADYEDYYDSDSSVSSDEDLIIENDMEISQQDNDETPPSSPEDDVFLSLSKLPYNINREYKLISVENDLPSLSHCSSISSEESADEFENLHHHNHHHHNHNHNGHFKTTTDDDDYNIVHTIVV